MKLVSYIGFRNNGSSASKVFCREDRRKFAAIGIVYPDTALATLHDPSTLSPEVTQRFFLIVLTALMKLVSIKLVGTMRRVVLKKSAGSSS